MKVLKMVQYKHYKSNNARKGAFPTAAPFLPVPHGAYLFAEYGILKCQACLVSLLQPGVECDSFKRQFEMHPIEKTSRTLIDFI